MFIYVFLSISTYHFPMLYSLSQINKRRKTSFNYFFLIAITNFKVYLNLNIYMYKWEVFLKKWKCRMVKVQFWTMCIALFIKTILWKA